MSLVLSKRPDPSIEGTPSLRVLPSASYVKRWASNLSRRENRMSKLGDFYVGVLDFFAVILPGAIATYLLEPHIRPYVVGPVISEPSSEPAGWALFLISSYFIGHLVFLLASQIDDMFFHKWRQRYRPREPKTPYALSESICEELVGPEEERGINTFQLVRSMLIARSPAAAADVHRMEADSKFFRSLIVVSAIAAFAFLDTGQIPLGLASFGVAIACALRYGERRLKSEAQAYKHFVALHSLGLFAPQCSSKKTEQGGLDDA